MYVIVKLRSPWKSALAEGVSVVKKKVLTLPHNLKASTQFLWRDFGLTFTFKTRITRKLFKE